MTEPRLSTVFDYSDLRLHPNGRRVWQQDANLRPKIAKVAVQTGRSNWIARDAGGVSDVKKFRRIPKPKNPFAEVNAQEEEQGEVFEGVEEEDEEVEVEQEATEENEEQGEQDTGVGQKRKRKRIDQQKGKRQRFMAYDTYLASEDYFPTPAPPPAESDAVARPSTTPNFVLPEPSGDLLKCIHRYASEYYTERGQLLNSSRSYRIEQRAKQHQRHQQQREEGRTPSPSPSESSSSSGSELDSESGSDSDEDYEEGEGAESNTKKGKGKGKGKGKAKAKGKGKRKRKTKRRGQSKLYVDMYKVFDGSALLALGMLVQEHIAELLASQSLANWEEEFRNAYGEDGDEDSLEEEVEDSGPEDVDRDNDENAAGRDTDQRVEGKKTAQEDPEKQEQDGEDDEDDKHEDMKLELEEDTSEDEDDLATTVPSSHDQARITATADRLHVHQDDPLGPAPISKLAASDDSPADKGEDGSEDGEDSSDLDSMIENSADGDDLSERSTDTADSDAEGEFS
ncbi:unnamed protein product [Cyclocybe aegerita]|uniref:Uncharacterized protein n=1 Tax=Cyclocybe aegerita TaxID=1973307 RepID=A0A8S0WCY2_CYCAE|nr:unnamed protein product [Cyclocybe aegerita]